MNISDGGEEFQRIVWWNARIWQSSILENMESEQGVVVETVVEFGVHSCFQEASQQHSLGLEFHMVKSKTTHGCWPVQDN